MTLPDRFRAEADLTRIPAANIHEMADHLSTLGVELHMCTCRQHDVSGIGEPFGSNALPGLPDPNCPIHRLSTEEPS